MAKSLVVSNSGAENTARNALRCLKTGDSSALAGKFELLHLNPAFPKRTSFARPRAKLCGAWKSLSKPHSLVVSVGKIIRLGGEWQI
jgi:hypothetical protein